FPQVQNVMFYILINATLLGGFRFIQRFFRTKWKLPKLDIVIFVLMTGLAIFATLSLLSVHMSREAIGIIQNLNFIWLILSSTAFLLTPLVYYYKTGNIEALWFLFAYLLHLSSLIFVSMQGLGLIYLPPWFERVIWFGVINLHFVLSILILFRVRGVVRKQAQSRINLARERADRLRDLVLQEEMERERIGADLHDEAGSRFAGIKMGLSKLAWNESNPAKKATLTKVIDDVDKICDLNRSISHQLLSVSLNKVGLKEALREYQSRLRKKGRLVGFLYSEGTLDGLTKSAGILVYRVIIEIVDGIYEDLDEFRIRIEEIRVSSELLLTVEAIEEVNLVKIDADSITINSLRTRLALFNRSREEPLQVDEKGIRIWLPKVVEAVGSRQVSGQGTKTRK
ncbi:MAG: signal transduction histidine kinase, partial [Limisphaerales bacterium]